jgi:lipopolysaccharide transport protein LptA
MAVEVPEVALPGGVLGGDDLRAGVDPVIPVLGLGGVAAAAASRADFRGTPAVAPVSVVAPFDSVPEAADAGLPPPDEPEAVASGPPTMEPAVVVTEAPASRAEATPAEPPFSEVAEAAAAGSVPTAPSAAETPSPTPGAGEPRPPGKRAVVGVTSGGVPLPSERAEVVRTSLGEAPPGPTAEAEADAEPDPAVEDAAAPPGETDEREAVGSAAPAEPAPPRGRPERLAHPRAPDELAPKPPKKSGAAYSVPKAAGDLLIAANSQTDFQVKDKRIVFTGSVIMKNERFYLTADKLVAYMKENDQGIDFAEAQGNVVVRMVENGQETGSSGLSNRAVFHPQTGEIVLRGWPQIRFGNKAHVASSATTEMSLFTDGRMKTSGRNQTMIVP